MKHKCLKIIFTSDTHGHVFPVDYAGGKPEDSGLLNMAYQVEKDENTLILDGGDTLQGTPLSQYYIEHSPEYSFHPMAEAFNALGCDYFTLGNHDFNFGYEALKRYLDAMAGECLCANVVDLRGELKLKKEVIHVMGNGLRVGITGVVTDYVMIWEQPENLSCLQVTDAYEAAAAACRRLRGKCDICVCIYHGGFEEDLETGQVLSCSGENIACRIGRELDFDILLTGHQHMMVDGVRLNGTYAVQPPANAGYYVSMEVKGNFPGENGSQTESSCQAGSAAAIQVISRMEKVGNRHGREPYQRLLPVEQDTQRWLDEPVGILEEEIYPEDKLEAALHGSKVAALFNAVQLAETGADFSCTSLGNSPVGLRKRVTMRNICGAYLFANTLVMLEVDREVLKASLERCASYFTLKDGTPVISEEFLRPKVEHYNYDFYAGLDYAFDLTKPVGQRVVRLRRLDGAPLTERKYTLVTSNYRATGTGGYEMLGKCKVLWRGAAEMPELISGYLRKRSPLGIGINGRFSVKW